MTEALIEHTALQWAVERAGITVEALSRKLNTSEAKIESWLSGDKKPTFKQAVSLANALHIPFGYLFMRDTPNEEFPIPDFRTVGSQKFKSDPNTLDLLRDIQTKREWFREYRELIGAEALEFVGSINKAQSIAIASAKIRNDLLTADATLFKSGRSPEQFLTALMAALEGLGVWVMRTGIVGNNTHRPLDVATFRGFALSDSHLPIIFINGQDAPSAQVFTIAHEISHIWLGSNDVSDESLSPAKLMASTRDEQFCNACAAEFLVPEIQMRRTWNADQPFSVQVKALARHFSVSKIVVARRALDLRLLEQDEFDFFYAQERARWAKLKANKKSGGSFYNTIPVRNGKSFTRSVVGEAMRGGMLLREASRLLGVKPSKLSALQAKW